MISKILRIIVALIAIIGIAGFIMVTRAEEGTPEMGKAASFMVNLAFWLLVIASVATVVLSVFSLLKKPAALKKTIFSLAILGVVFAISYFAASDAQVLDANKQVIEKAGEVSKWSEAGLNFSLLLLLIGGVFFIVDLLKSLVK